MEKYLSIIIKGIYRCVSQTAIASHPCLSAFFYREKCDEKEKAKHHSFMHLPNLRKLTTFVLALSECASTFLRTFVLTASAHPYCARKFSRQVMHESAH